MNFRHGHWQTHRAWRYELLAKAGLAPARLRRFANCGSHAWIQQTQDEPHRYRVTANRCKDRWCEVCAREKANRTAANLLARFPRGRTRFVTFTLKHSAAPLSAQLDRLYKAFKAIRRAKTLNKCFTGGIMFLELQLGQRDGLWHVHLHVITQGAFIPWDLLRRAWHNATGDSFIVDVREIANPQTTVAYVTKYASKLIPQSVRHDAAKFLELIAACDARRTFNTFGSWTGLRLSHSDAEDAVWEFLWPLPKLLTAAAAGERWAEAILAQVRRRETADCEPARPPPEA